MPNAEIEERHPLLGNRSRSESVPEQKLGKWKIRLAGTSVLLTTAFERMAFYSLTGNLYLFLNTTPFQWMSYNAMAASYIFTGVAYFMAPFWGWLADAVLGKFKAIIVGLILYIGGYVTLVFMSGTGDKDTLPNLCMHTAASYVINPISNTTDVPMNYRGNYSYNYNDTGPVEDQKCGWLVYLILLVTGLAVGCFKANLAPFGADQVRLYGHGITRVFMNWYYWSINLGSLVALGCIGYIQQRLLKGFYYGYLAATVSLVVAFITFVISKPTYVVEKPTKSVLGNIFHIMCEAYRSRNRQHLKEQHQNRLTTTIDSLPASAEVATSPSFLDMAKVRFGGSFHESAVEDVKSMWRVLLVFFSFVPYWMIYFQVTTSFIAQGLHMRFSNCDCMVNVTHQYRNTCIGNSTEAIDIQCKDKFMIPVAWLTLFDVVFLIVLIPLLDRIVYPLFERCNCAINLATRIAIGMTFAAMAMLVAGCLEMHRLDLLDKQNHVVLAQPVGNDVYYAADIWIFWQIPQYALIGVSEAFTSIAGLEFAYSHAPTSIKSLIMGMYYCCMGCGSFLGTSLMYGVRASPWFSNKDRGNINYGHMDYYLFLLSGVQIVMLLIFHKVIRPLVINKRIAPPIIPSILTESSQQRPRPHRTTFASTSSSLSVSTNYDEPAFLPEPGPVYSGVNKRNNSRS